MNIDTIIRHRDIFAMLVLIGVSGTLILPILALFAVQELGASNFEASLYFIAGALIGMCVVPQIAKWVDRSRQHRWVLFLSLIWMMVGTIALTFAHDPLDFIVIGALFFSFFGAPNSMIFAMARNRLFKIGQNDPSAISTLRIGFILGWIIGPAVSGALVATGWSFVDIFKTQGVVLLIAAFSSLAVFDPSDAQLPVRETDETERTPSTAIPFAFWVLVISVAFILSGDMFRITALPLLMASEMSATPSQIALAFSVVPIVEIPATLFCIQMARKYGERTVILFGAVCGLIYFLGLPNTQDIAVVYCLQALYAFIPAATIGIAFGYAQTLLPERPAYATAMVMSGQSAAVVIGALLVGIATSMMSLTVGFFLPVGFLIVAIILNVFAFSSRQNTQLS